MKTNNRGFTLIELMIASSVFAVILLSASAALTQISRLYYKGIISSRTQNVSRSVMDEISRSIQFTSEDPVVVPHPDDPNSGAVCIGDNRFLYQLNAQLGQEGVDFALFRDEIPASGCDPSAPRASNGAELLEGSMRLAEFAVEGGTNDLWDVSIKVVYGDDDLLNDIDQPNVTCKGGVTGSQWCAVSGLKTKVFKRVPTP